MAVPLQTLSVGLVLLGLSLAALWAMPPFWVPYLCGLVFVAIVLWHTIYGRLGTTVLWSAGPLQSVMIVIVAALGVVGAYLAVSALEGRRKPAVEMDNLPDMEVPQMDPVNPAGNFVAIDCGGFYLVLDHLREGGVWVRQGDVVATGDELGEIGNSGNSSEPHLHIHAQRGLPENAPLGGEPLGLTINGRFLVRNDRLKVE